MWAQEYFLACSINLKRPFYTRPGISVRNKTASLRKWPLHKTRKGKINSCTENMEVTPCGIKYAIPWYSFLLTNATHELWPAFTSLAFLINNTKMKIRKQDKMSRSIHTHHAFLKPTGEAHYLWLNPSNTKQQKGWPLSRQYEIPQRFQSAAPHTLVGIARHNAATNHSCSETL